MFDYTSNVTIVGMSCFFVVQKRYATEVVAEELGFAEGRKEETTETTNESLTTSDDNLPF